MQLGGSKFYRKTRINQNRLISLNVRTTAPVGFLWAAHLVLGRNEIIAFLSSREQLQKQDDLAEIKIPVVYLLAILAGWVLWDWGGFGDPVFLLGPADQVTRAAPLYLVLAAFGPTQHLALGNDPG